MDWRGDAGIALAYNQLGRLKAGSNVVAGLTYPVPLGTGNNYVITGTSNSNIWLVGNDFTSYRFDGTQWLSQAVPPPAAWGSHADSGVYFVSSTPTSTTLYDGTGPHTLGTSTFDAGAVSAMDIWIASPSDIYAAGRTGPVAAPWPVLTHWNGSAWSPVATPDAGVPFSSVWASGAGDLWVGGGHLLLRFNGTQWTDFSAMLTAGEYIMDIFGTAPNSVWAGGQRSIYFFNGSTLVVEAPFVTAAANGFVITSKGELFAFGIDSLIHQRVGTTWFRIDVGNPVNLNNIYAAPEGGMWAAGYYGSVLFRPP
jgi:hypothetical protein